MAGHWQNFSLKWLEQGIDASGSCHQNKITPRNLVISQLELAVIAFATCAIIIYGIQWSKPKNVGATTTILRFEDLIPERVLALINGQRDSMKSYLLMDFSEENGGSSNRSDENQDYHDDDVGWVAVMLGAMIFGGIHVGHGTLFSRRILSRFSGGSQVYIQQYSLPSYN